MNNRKHSLVWLGLPASYSLITALSQNLTILFTCEWHSHCASDFCSQSEWKVSRVNVDWRACRNIARKENVSPRSQRESPWLRNSHTTSPSTSNDDANNDGPKKLELMSTWEGEVGGLCCDCGRDCRVRPRSICIVHVRYGWTRFRRPGSGRQGLQQ